MNVLISGSHGLIGSAVAESLERRGDKVIRLMRGESAAANVAAIAWDPEAGVLDAANLNGIDAVVHLAGENIADGRWTLGKKKRILESRVLGTRTLCRALAEMKSPPKVLISGSAIGYYGERGSEVLTEDAEPGKNFVARVCVAWERETAAAEARGIRVVRLRTGIVLSAGGGALAKMLSLFNWGVGGVVGPGTQYMSWITLDDIVGAILFSIDDAGNSGAINGTAPHAVTNREFTAALGKAMGRPTVVPMPAPALRLMLGEMADELLLASARAVPTRLEESGFVFRDAALAPALARLLARKS